MIIENPLNQNKMLKGPQAFELGIADAMFEPADFLEQSLRWAAAVLRGEIAVERARRSTATRPPGTPRCDAAQGARRRARSHGAAPAPYRALELHRAGPHGRPRRGLRRRGRGAGRPGHERRAARRAVRLRPGAEARQAARPARRTRRWPAPVTKVGVVGAGLMASQLALLFARRLEVPVVLTDLDQARVDKGVGYVHGEIDKLLRQGPDRRPTRPTGSRRLVTGSLTKDALRRRRLRHRGRLRGDGGQAAGVRRGRGGRLGRVRARRPTPRRCRSPRWRRSCEHPERVVGFHFFNPVAVLPLLEIVRGEQTDDATLATAFAVGQDAEEDLRAGRRTRRRSSSTGCSPASWARSRRRVDEGTAGRRRRPRARRRSGCR